MYLKKAPSYYVKNGKRKAVFHTVVADELSQQGWVLEGEESPAAFKVPAAADPEPVKVSGVPIPITTPQPGEAASVDTSQLEEVVDINDMTKAQLVEYAKLKGVKVYRYDTKAEIIDEINEAAGNG